MFDEREPGAALQDFTRKMTARCFLARNHNDGRPVPAWSTGERLIVALVLHDRATLDAEGCTTEQAEHRLGGDLKYYGYPGTVGDWLDEVREAIGEQR